MRPEVRPSKKKKKLKNLYVLKIKVFSNIKRINFHNLIIKKQMWRQAAATGKV